MPHPLRAVLNCYIEMVVCFMIVVAFVVAFAFVLLLVRLHIVESCCAHVYTTDMAANPCTEADAFLWLSVANRLTSIGCLRSVGLR